MLDARVELRVSASEPSPLAFVDICNGRNRYQYAVHYALALWIDEGGDQRAVRVWRIPLTHIGYNAAYMTTLSGIVVDEIKLRLSSGSILWGIDNFEHIVKHIGSMTDSGSVHVDKIVFARMEQKTNE